MLRIAEIRIQSWSRRDAAIRQYRTGRDPWSLAVAAGENARTLQRDDELELQASRVTGRKGASVVSIRGSSVLRVETRQIEHDAHRSGIVRKRVFGRSDEHVDVGNLESVDSDESGDRRIHDNALALDRCRRLLSKASAHVACSAKRERGRR